jgi:hypothetical protein
MSSIESLPDIRHCRGDNHECDSRGQFDDDGQGGQRYSGEAEADHPFDCAREQEDE